MRPQDGANAQNQNIRLKIFAWHLMLRFNLVRKIFIRIFVWHLIAPHPGHLEDGPFANENNNCERTQR